MSAEITGKKGPTAKELREAREQKRRDVGLFLMQKALIYLAVCVGVMLTESILDIERTQELVFRFAWNKVIVAAMVAAFFMYQFESGGDKTGKKKNLSRRVTHAFSQGAALRGIVEWLFLLFALTRS